jgi:D-lactate dehydrogenase
MGRPLADIMHYSSPGVIFHAEPGMNAVPSTPGPLELPVRCAAFSTKGYEREFLDRAAARHGHHLTYLEPRLTAETLPLAADYPAICVFVNDELPAAVLRPLAAGGLKVVALRCAGFNNVDLAAADELGLAVVRVPAYSPHAVAEHTFGLILSLNRKLHRAYGRVRDGNFSLSGLLGFDLVGRTIGVIGGGKIGSLVAGIAHGFGCRVLVYDPFPNPAALPPGGRFAPLEEIYRASDIVSLHCPLSPETYHLIGDAAIDQMKPGVMLINTGRGALIDTGRVIEGLKSGKIGYLGIDVYEEEADLFFEDLSDTVIQDDVFARLLTFPNVMVTGHQGFFTREALIAIAETTMANIADVAAGRACANRVTSQLLVHHK